MASVAAALGHPLGRHAAACKPYPLNPCKTVTVAGVAAALGHPLGRHAASCKTLKVKTRMPLGHRLGC